MPYAADPGAVFASDTHRRTLGHLPLSTEDPTDLNSLGHRISEDPYHGLETVNELEDVLRDLEADGYASNTANGWRQTKKGLDALNAPAPTAPESSGPALLGGLESGGNSHG